MGVLGLKPRLPSFQSILFWVHSAPFEDGFSGHLSHFYTAEGNMPMILLLKPPVPLKWIKWQFWDKISNSSKGIGKNYVGVKKKKTTNLASFLNVRMFFLSTMKNTFPYKVASGRLRILDFLGPYNDINHQTDMFLIHWKNIDSESKVRIALSASQWFCDFGWVIAPLQGWVYLPSKM